MKYISFLEQASPESIQHFAHKRNLTQYLPEHYQHPQEDFLLASEIPPIFVVADGVTLNFLKLVENKTPYPNPSPAGEVSKIFCTALQRSAMIAYETFSEKDIVEIFKTANSEVGTYNRKIGKIEFSGNKTGYYSATGSCIVIRDSKAYWASICDSYVAQFDAQMNLKYMSSGNCSPYAVINGEDRMIDHIEKGVLDIESGDRLFVFTDGFEQHAKNPEFQKFFVNWDDLLRARVTEFSKKMNTQDPEGYGHERSLIAILV